MARRIKATEGRLVLGRTIVAVDFNLFDDGRGGVTMNPVFTLDNGDVMGFDVRETESQVYGIDCMITVADRAIKHWCLGCGAYSDGACEIVGHESERMRLHNRRWVRHDPPIIVRREASGLIAVPK